MVRRTVRGEGRSTLAVVVAELRSSETEDEGIEVEEEVVVEDEVERTAKAEAAVGEERRTACLLVQWVSVVAEQRAAREDTEEQIAVRMSAAVVEEGAEARPEEEEGSALAPVLLALAKAGQAQE